jgi:hypothetical protein
MKTCPQCGNEVQQTQGKRPRVYCSNACKQKASRIRATEEREILRHTVATIYNLPNERRLENQEWVKSAALADKYPQWPQEFILRGVLASEYSNVSLDYFEQRYLQEDKSIPQNAAFTTAYKQLVEEARQEQWSMK